MGSAVAQLPGRADTGSWSTAHDPAARVIALLRIAEDGAGQLMTAQSGCTAAAHSRPCTPIAREGAASGKARNAMLCGPDAPRRAPVGLLSRALMALCRRLAAA